MSWAQRENASRWVDRLWLAAKIVAVLCVITPFALIGAAILFDPGPYQCPAGRMLCLEHYEIKGSSDAASALRRMLVSRIEDGASEEEIVQLLLSAGMSCSEGRVGPPKLACSYQAQQRWYQFPGDWYVEVLHPSTPDGRPEIGLLQYRILAP